MIFLGDLACPDDKIESFVEWTNEQEIFNNELLIINFEGNVVDDVNKRRNLKIHNNSRVLSAFAQCEKVIVSLANNHMYDYPEEIEYTKSILEEKNIGYFGLLENGRIIPYEYENSDGKKYAFFGHCWRLYTRTNRNTVNNVRVVDCDYPLFVEAVSEYIKVHSDVEVYCFMHWNYDLEILPFPMHRKIARELVDIGVKGVIGNHSHVSQGMEVYKGRPIAYCLGNFYFPSGYYFEGKLNFPCESKTTYGVRINKSEYHTIWFNSDVNNHDIEINKIEAFAEGEICKSFSQFDKMNEDEYVKYFIENRKKNIIVPVFKDFNGIKYKIDEMWAVLRVKILRFLSSLRGL